MVNISKVRHEAGSIWFYCCTRSGRCGTRRRIDFRSRVGVYYDPKVAHFETLDKQALMPICERELSDLPQQLTLHAKYTSDSADTYIVASAGDGWLVVVRKHGWRTCDVGFPWMNLTSYSSNGGPDLTTTDVVELFKDTLVRHEKAFGGKGAFLNWLDTETKKAKQACPDLWSCNVTTYDSLRSDLQEALKNYRGH
jgi:hypothetical protein